MRHVLALRLIHGLTALLFLPMLAGGYFWLRPMANTDPIKLEALMYHMAFGMFIAALTVLRLVLRLRQAKPRAGGLALWVQRGFYLVILLMPVTGMTMALTGRLNEIVFARSGEPLPDDLASLTGHWFHGLFALILTLLVVLHLAGALRGALRGRHHAAAQA